jgi:hypothetical protein
VKSGAIGDLDRTVIVAVSVVRVVQMTVDEIVSMVAVRNSLVATATAVIAAIGVAFAVLLRGAARRMSRVDGECVLVDVAFVRIMHVAVVQVVRMIVVPHGRVTAVGTVLVRMIGVGRVLLRGCGHWGLQLPPGCRNFSAVAGG